MKTRLTSEKPLGCAPFAILVLVLLAVEVPLDEGSVARSREKEFDLVVAHLFLANCKRGDPAAVSFEISFVLESVIWLLLLFFH